MARLETLHLRRAHWQQMAAHVDQQAPLEACGLVAGKEGTSRQVIPITNELHSQTRFRFAPQEHVDAFFLLEERGWELLAIYHAHPAGQAEPSAADIAEAAYPEAAYLVWSLVDGEWHCRAFRISVDKRVEEIFISIAP